METRRRVLAACACAAVCTTPIAATAQTPARASPYRVVVVAYFPPPAIERFKTFALGQLRTLGYTEGRNLTLEVRSLFGLDNERQDAVAAEVVRLRPDVILADGTSAGVRVARATDTIPIVLWASVDPVCAGLAQSLAHPGKNVTGLLTDAGPSVEEKRLELLLELVPTARRIAFFGSQGSWDDAWADAMRRGAARRHVTVVSAVGNPAIRYSDSVEIVKREKPDAVFVALSPTTSVLRGVIGTLTVEQRVPTACGIVEMAEENCLLAYGQSSTEFMARSLTYVDRILKGARPGDLPIEQPTKFHLVVNLKLARQIGVQVPPSILWRADRVIE